MKIASRLCGVMGAVVLLASPAFATQTVQPVKDTGGTAFTGGPTAWSTNGSGGGQVVFYGRYPATNSTTESGLGLLIKYDETKFTSVTVDNVLPKCQVAVPQTQLVVPATPGASQFAVAWADISTRANGAVGWPGLPDGNTAGNPPAAPTSPANPSTGGCLDITLFYAPNPPPLTQVTTAVALPTNLFKFTGTLVGGFTTGQSTLITIDAKSSSSGFTPQTLTVNGVAIQVNGAVSRKVHGAAGTFDIPLVGGSLTAGQAITVEPRAIGSGYQIVFQYSTAPTSSGVATTSSGNVSGPVFSGNEAILTLTGVTNASRVQVNLPGVNGAVDATAFVGFLLGDVNGSRLVNSTDILTVKAVSGQAASASTFKTDLNASGLTNSTDILTVKSVSGQTLP